MMDKNPQRFPDYDFSKEYGYQCSLCGKPVRYSEWLPVKKVRDLPRTRLFRRPKPTGWEWIHWCTDCVRANLDWLEELTTPEDRERAERWIADRR